MNEPYFPNPQDHGGPSIGRDFFVEAGGSPTRRYIRITLHFDEDVPTSLESLNYLAEAARRSIEDVEFIHGRFIRLQHITVISPSKQYPATICEIGTHNQIRDLDDLGGANIAQATDRMFKSGDRVPVKELLLQMRVLVDPSGQEHRGFGGFKKVNREIVPVGAEYCAAMSIVIGSEHIRHENGEQIQTPHVWTTQASQRLHEYAAGLHDVLSWDIDGGVAVADLEKYVRLIAKDTRIVIFEIESEDTKYAYEYTEFCGPEFTFDDIPLGTFGKTIFIELNHELHHYRPLLGMDIRDYHAKGNDKVRICPGCYHKFRYDHRSARVAWTNHKCGGRAVCEACHCMYSVEKLKEHQKKKCVEPCAGCGTTIYNNDSCKRGHGVKNGPCSTYAEYCAICASLHAPDGECTPFPCPGGCGTKLSKEDVKECNHRCYLKTKKKPGEKGAPKPIQQEFCYSADFESRLDEVEDGLKGLPTSNSGEIIKGVVYKHTVVLSGLCNLADQTIIHRWGHHIDEDTSGKDPIESLINFFVNPTRIANKEKCIVYFHNGGKYDIRFVWSYLIKNHPEYIIDQVIDGSNIKKLVLSRQVVTFLDSRNHLAPALSKLPAMLGLPKNLVKGEFPYLFLNKDTMDYDDIMPDLKYFEPERRNKENRVKLLEWYEEEKIKVGNHWSMKEKILEYFDYDLKILAAAMATFSKICIEAGVCDPLGVITLPSNAYNTFATYHLKPDTIPVLRNFPRFHDKGEFCGTNEEGFARAAYSGGRTELRRLHVKLTTEERAEGWRLVGYDFKSMYPSVMVNHEYPVGDGVFKAYKTFDEDYPLRTPELRAEFLRGHGVACVEIEHRQGQYTPLLGSKEIDRNGFPKLCFSNKRCRTIEEVKRLETQYKPEYKGGRKVYTMPEIREAVAQGYTLVHVYCTLFFPEVRTDIYNSYYASNYSIKTKYSDPPNLDWDDPVVCAEYRRNRLEREGIVIPEDIRPDKWHKKNDGLCAVGKLMCNSFYGKLGASPTRKETLISTDPDDEMDILRQHETKDRNIFLFDNATVFTVDNDDEVSSSYGNTNVMHAAYVTGYARIKITRTMQYFGKGLCYGDTDSVIGVLPPGKADPPGVGIYLGDLEYDFKDKKTNKPIELGEFVGIAAKSYMVKDVDGNVIKSKFKGLSLGDARNADLITFDWMVKAANLMRRGMIVELTAHDIQFRYNKRTMVTTSQDSIKTIKADAFQLKGDLATDGRVYPYGSRNCIFARDAQWVESKPLPMNRS